jgi:hypothetical protein
MTQSREAGAQPDRPANVVELAKHWLWDIGCVHDDSPTGGSNKPSCACGWSGERVGTVGAAAELWAQHALAALSNPAASDTLEICPACNGSGVAVADQTCGTCNGSGGVAASDRAEKMREALRVSAQAFRLLEETAIAQNEPDKARNFIELGDRCRAALQGESK